MKHYTLEIIMYVHIWYAAIGAIKGLPTTQQPCVYFHKLMQTSSLVNEF